MPSTPRTVRPDHRAPSRRRRGRHAFRPRPDQLDDRVLPTVPGVVAVGGPQALVGSPFPASVVEFALEPSDVAGNDVQYASPSFELADDSGATIRPLASPGPVGFNPGQIARAYGFDQVVLPGGIKGDGTGQTIVILDAFDNPNIVNDLAEFNRAFGLPDPPSFTVFKQTVGGQPPATDPGWALEIALDVQWAHAMAPGADIILAEAYDNSYANLLGTARYMASLPGVSVISMSFGSDEFPGQTSFDDTFVTPDGHAGVTFVAASGDTGVVSYPASSSRVVGVGGTTLFTDASGTYLGEAGWVGSGGGTSRFVARPGYQDAVVAGSFRQSPDVAYNADPSSGFAVYDSFNNGSTTPWVQVGGTSASAPQWASLIAIANQARALNGLPSLDGPSQTLPMLYQLPSSSFRDVTEGSTQSGSAGPGYDLVTGLGTPLASLVIAGLAGTPTTPVLGDAGFEAVSVGSGGGAYAYAPAGSAWSFSGGAGVSGDGSGFTEGNPAAPQGAQVAFLQEAGSSISQTVAGWAAGRYAVTFRAAQRGNAQASAQDFRVLVDGREVGAFRPGSTSYEALQTASFEVPEGPHTVTFEGINGDGGDNTAFLDDVAIVAAPFDAGSSALAFADDASAASSWGVLAPSYPIPLDESALPAPVVATTGTRGSRPRPTPWSFR